MRLTALFFSLCAPLCAPTQTSIRLLSDGAFVEIPFSTASDPSQVAILAVEEHRITSGGGCTGGDVDCVRGVIEGFVRQQQQVAAVVAHVPHEDDPVVEDGTIDLAEWQPPPFSVDANVRLSVPIMRTTPLPHWRL